MLYWTGNQWSYKTLPVNAVTYNSSSITLYSTNGWGTCVGDGDVDTVTLNEPINTISKLTDTANLITVSINAAFYVVWSNITGVMTTLGAVRYVESYKIGTIPATYRPVHTTTITLPGIIQPARYWGGGRETQFAGRQINIHMGCTITPAGEVFLSLVLPTDSANYSTATLSSAAYLIVPIACSYPTKVFV